jgi:23S rRNA (cytidine1920-2'-O)/16S rRNA (cytidine1409-2'-O)-methyltransferase
LGRKARRRLRPLEQELERMRPDIANPAAVVAAGEVLVDGRIVTNPASLVPVGASIVVRRGRPLRGEVKLRAALAVFGVRADGRVALDAGAAAGGFTRALLEAGAARVYAVDAGHGQLLGSLRSDPRVVNLEGVNLGELDTTRVPEEVDLVTLDLSYLPLADAVPQLGRLALARETELVALVKPAFELRLAAPPASPELLARAVELAWLGIERAGWQVVAQMRSPVTGAHGAVEFFVHARRRC